MVVRSACAENERNTVTIAILLPETLCGWKPSFFVREKLLDCVRGS